MKELQIIIKTPDDGNPLNQKIGREPRNGRMTAGWKMVADDGKTYGDYIDMPDDWQIEGIKHAISILLSQAIMADMMVTLGEKEEEKDGEALR